MSTALIPVEQLNAMQEIEDVAKSYGVQAMTAENAMVMSLLISEGQQRIDRLLDDKIMARIHGLQGSSLGFKTDKQYDVATVKKVAVEAFLRGFRMVNNEVNIIAGNFYAAKAGCLRRILEWPGLTKFQWQVGVPEDRGGKCLVEAMAKWKLDGTDEQMEFVGKLAFSIKRNAGMSDDAVKGKAERKLFASVLSRLSTFIMPDGEIDDDGDVVNEGAKKVRRSSLNDFAEPEKEKAAPTYDPNVQSQLVDEWKQVFDACGTLMEVGAEQRRAATSEGLSPESLSAINAYANQRRRQLK